MFIDLERTNLNKNKSEGHDRAFIWSQSIGAKYFVMCVDDFQETFGSMFWNINHVFEICKKIKAMVENESGQQFKVLRSDEGG
jgi:hypothetical protein